MTEPVEEYLDRLLLTLSGTPRQVRHTLAEVEAHLHDAVAEATAAGLSEQQAQSEAVRRIGSAHAVAGRTALFTRPTAAIARRTVLAGSLVAGVALIAVGVSSAIAWGLSALRGGTFIEAPWPRGSYTQADCARWLAGDPATHNCVTAMTYDHMGETLLNGLAAGVVGLLILLAYRLLRRRWNDRATLTALPMASAEAVGAILACLVAVITFGQAIDLEAVRHGLGAGEQFSLAAAAAAAALFFGTRLRHAVRARTA